MSKTSQILKKLSLDNKRNERLGSDESNSFHRTQLEDTINKVMEKLKRHFYESLNLSIWEKELEVTFTVTLIKTNSNSKQLKIIFKKEVTVYLTFCRL